MGGNIVPNAWRKAVGKLLEAADLSHSTLSGEMGLARTNVTRWLSGAVTPTASTVRNVNSAMARLLSEPQIEPYLAVLAIIEDLLPRRTDDLDGEALGLLIKEFDPYFEGGAMRAVVAAGEKLEAHWQRAIMGGLTVARGGELVRRLQGKPPRSSSLAMFLAMFDEAGVPLEGLLVNEALLQRFMRDRFEASMIEALTKFSGTGQTRVEAARAIMQSFDEALGSALDLALSDDWAWMVMHTRIREFLRQYPHKRSRSSTAGRAGASTPKPRREKNR